MLIFTWFSFSSNAAVILSSTHNWDLSETLIQKYTVLQIDEAGLGFPFSTVISYHCLLFYPVYTLEMGAETIGTLHLS